MTKNQALAKARMVWGKTAWVEDRGKPHTVNGHILTDRFAVGRVLIGMFAEVKGDGPSWEAAFAAAEKREADWKKHVENLRRQNRKASR